MHLKPSLFCRQPTTHIILLATPFRSINTLHYFYIFIQTQNHSREGVSVTMEGTSTRKFSKICVFCGSSPRKNGEFVEAAVTLGVVLAERKIHLVYGGGNRGLMGCVATAAQNKGSRVLGVIPKALAVENIVGKTIGDEVQVSSMHERMSIMVLNADAFIALPGGFGTLEEIF